MSLSLSLSGNKLLISFIPMGLSRRRSWQETFLHENPTSIICCCWVAQSLKQTIVSSFCVCCWVVLLLIKVLLLLKRVRRGQHEPIRVHREWTWRPKQIGRRRSAGELLHHGPEVGGVRVKKSRRSSPRGPATPPDGLRHSAFWAQLGRRRGGCDGCGVGN